MNECLVFCLFVLMPLVFVIIVVERTKNASEGSLGYMLFVAPTIIRKQHGQLTITDSEQGDLSLVEYEGALTQTEEE